MSSRRAPAVSASLLLVAALSAAGCASSPNRVLTSINSYHYWMAEYSARCAQGGPMPAGECRAWHADLVAHKARLEAAGEAVKRGGKLPLQLAAMKRAEKAVRR